MNPTTTLLRQVHPNFIPDGQLSSQAFIPFPKDNGKVSVYDGDRITAAESYHHYTEVLRYESDSVWGITCEEVASVELNSAADPLKDFPSHAVIDFTTHAETNFRKLAKRLKVLALARGCLYRRGS